jgi:hypothetical protein
MSLNKLSKVEKETVIQFDESTNIATVYTASWTVAKSLKKAGYKSEKKQGSGWWFKIPVNEICIQGGEITGIG